MNRELGVLQTRLLFGWPIPRGCPLQVDINHDVPLEAGFGGWVGGEARLLGFSRCLVYAERLRLDLAWPLGLDAGLRVLWALIRGEHQPAGSGCPVASRPSGELHLDVGGQVCVVLPRDDPRLGRSYTIEVPGVDRAAGLPDAVTLCLRHLAARGD